MFNESSIKPPLPLELVLCIAEELNHDSAALLSLCLLNTGWLDLVLPLLYKKVRISTPNSIQTFCTTILDSDHFLGTHVSSLDIDPPVPSSDDLNPLTVLIHQALQHMPNLTCLVLNIDTPSSIALYNDPLPFSLRRLSCCFVSASHIFSFLSTQSSLTHLTLHESNLLLRQPIRRSAPPSQDFLPNLTHIRASPLIMHSLVPGRPVSHVDAGTLVLSNATAYLFCEALKVSVAPGGVQEVVVCVATTKFWTAASDFITKLSGVCGNSLKKLRLNMPNLRVLQTDVVNHAILVEVLAASLGGFTRLEDFQFDGQTTDVSPDIIVTILDSVAKMSFWTNQCPTLSSVTLFGVKLS